MLHIDADEYLELIKKIPEIPVMQEKWWWTKTPANKTGFVVYVERSGKTKNICGSNSPKGGVRPVVTIPNLRIGAGKKILIGSTVFTVIKKDTAFADSIVEQTAFHNYRYNCNNFSKANINAHINSPRFLRKL